LLQHFHSLLTPRTIATTTGRCYAFSRSQLRTEGQHESGIHYTGNQARDFKIESGIAIARRQSKAEGDEADENRTPENISGWQETNRSGTEKEMGENQGSKEIEKSDLV
jgi:hypothetical protein